MILHIPTFGGSCGNGGGACSGGRGDCGGWGGSGGRNSEPPIRITERNIMVISTCSNTIVHSDRT